MNPVGQDVLPNSTYLQACTGIQYVLSGGVVTVSVSLLIKCQQVAGEGDVKADGSFHDRVYPDTGHQYRHGRVHHGA
jgi:hypothetical protein